MVREVCEGNQREVNGVDGEDLGNHRACSRHQRGATTTCSDDIASTSRLGNDPYSCVYANHPKGFWMMGMSRVS